MRWIIPEPINIPDSMLSYYQTSPYLAEALIKKNITRADQAIPFLDHTRYTPTDPAELPGVEIAARRILQAIHKKERIGIWGDFDVDGQTSTTLLVSLFRRLGIPVEYHIPIRSEESHGILKHPLQQFLSKGIDVLITCDTGITEHASLEYAEQQGTDVIITDHHTPPERLPGVLAAINPHFVGEDHPFRYLSGVGTAYILTRRLSAELGFLEEWERAVLDLVAMGTIADVAPLKKENRFMAQVGLERLRENPRLCIQEILNNAVVPLEAVDEQGISFTIAPRLNAVGRLGDANPIVEYLLTTDLSLAKRAATEMEGLNNQRKMMVKQVYQAAVSQIEKDPDFVGRNTIILSNPNWPAGILGIVANHLCTHYGKPTILLTEDQNGKLKGSARSIEGINITQALEGSKDLLISFGGHAMAAGMALLKENFQPFLQRMETSISSIVDIDKIDAALQIDAYLPLEQADEAFMQVLDKLSPFGAGNPSPTFLAEHLQVVKAKFLDRDNIHRSIQLKSTDGHVFEVKWWHAFETSLPSGEIDLAYTIHRSTYRGETQIEIEWIDAHTAEQESLPPETSKPIVKLNDFRFADMPLKEIARFVETNRSLCWGENVLEMPFPVVDRLHLKSHAILVLLHMPPHATILQKILAEVQPTQIALFNLPTKWIDPKIFLQTLMGMLKYAVRERHGRISLEQYAAITGLTSRMVELGIQLLQFEGKLQIQTTSDDERIVQIGKGAAHPSSSMKAQKELLNAFIEMRAFQRFLLRIPPERIIRDYYPEHRNNRNN